MLCKEDIIKIRKSLPKGSIKAIAKKLEIDRVTVSSHMNGHMEFPNMDIINAAIDIRNEYQDKQKLALSKLNGDH